MNLKLYGLIVFLHIVSAVLAIGPLFIIMPIIRRLRSVERGVEKALLSVIAAIIRLVMHAGHALVVTGVILIVWGPWPWHTSWVLMTFFVLAVSAFFLATGFTRVLRDFDRLDVSKDELLNRLNKTAWLYIGLMLLILWLMVQKPMLW